MPRKECRAPTELSKIRSWNGIPWQITALSQTEISLTRDGCDPFSLSISAFESLVKEGKMLRSEPKAPSSITSEGQILLEQARDVDSATAVFRNRVINPDQYDDEEQAQIAERAPTIP
ncbi:MAG TPA: hypothetical protein VIW48_04495, partial [Nitrospiraceae bacterium]